MLLRDVGRHGGGQFLDDLFNLRPPRGRHARLRVDGAYRAVGDLLRAMLCAGLGHGRPELVDALGVDERLQRLLHVRGRFGRLCGLARETDGQGEKKKIFIQDGRDFLGG
ncbi:hypothetical protein [Massilia genomosp. 1]|uniref:Uncharacterized protein n=1 Tax=Massilia genomosp. 1 TaxID=2609280 RepID=A0ABX0MTK3_9BURK|nr:hypothetical protein [Massilia genomosp. 1]NHZ63260.1 hypothetical protein [Massilia genomosp. 1]